MNWSVINGFENYRVSDTGIIMNVKKNRVVKQVLNKCGYMQLQLCSNGRRVNKLVHQIIAEAFIPNPNNYHIVNHKDECKTNNCIDNLEWCTSKYNNAYGTRLKRFSETRKGHPVSAETREKISNSLKGTTAWNKGKRWSEETRLKMSIARKEYLQRKNNT